LIAAPVRYQRPISRSTRLEDGGLRCAFHGWLFDVHGRCWTRPSAGQRVVQDIRQTAYRVSEKSGILFAYLGPGEPPLLPAVRLASRRRRPHLAFKGLIACNWHAVRWKWASIRPPRSWHRFFHDEDSASGYGKCSATDRSIQTCR